MTFRVVAPTARQVQLQPGGDNGLGKGPFDMSRDAQGVWSVTTPPAVPGFHYYWLLIDGVAANDPSSETYFGWGKPTSGIEIPEPGADYYSIRNVPHGAVAQYWYHSHVTGQWRRAYVYTPPGYRASVRDRYPVLYLQHGAGEDARGWSEQGKANFILDNLIAAGKARPMLVVMETGYATRSDAGAGPGHNQQAGPLGEIAGFEEVVVKDLVPFVDSSFRTLADREHRAIAGLSMGSMQALQIGLGHQDLFASIGAFSNPPLGGFDPATSYNGVFRDANVFNARVKLLWFGAGTAEWAFLERAKTVHTVLRRAGIRSVLFESAGTTHEWQTWRRCLNAFAQRLFEHHGG